MEKLRDFEYKGLHTVETLDNGILRVHQECDVEFGGKTFKYMQEFDGETFTKKVLDPSGKVLGEGVYKMPRKNTSCCYRGYDENGREFKDGVYTGEVSDYTRSQVYYDTDGQGFMIGEHVSGNVIDFNFRDIHIKTLNDEGLTKKVTRINADTTSGNRPLDEREIEVFKYDETSKRTCVFVGGIHHFADYALYKKETYTPDFVLRKISATQDITNDRVKIGTEELFDKNGHTQSTINYKDNKKDEAIFYNPDGSIKEKINCADDLNSLLQVLAKTDNPDEAFDLITKICRTSLPLYDESESYDSAYRHRIGNYYRNKLLGRDVKHIRDNLYVIGAIHEDSKRGLLWGTAIKGRRALGKLVDIKEGKVLSDIDLGYGDIKTRDFIKVEDGKVYFDYKPERKQFIIPEEITAVKKRVAEAVKGNSSENTFTKTPKTAGKTVKKPNVYE